MRLVIATTLLGAISLGACATDTTDSEPDDEIYGVYEVNRNLMFTQPADSPFAPQLTFQVAVYRDHVVDLDRGVDAIIYNRSPGVVWFEFAEPNASVDYELDSELSSDPSQLAGGCSALLTLQSGIFDIACNATATRLRPSP
jgi:hypothetical protein